MDPVIVAAIVLAAVLALGLIAKLLGLAAKTAFLVALVAAGIAGYFLVLAPTS